MNKVKFLFFILLGLYLLVNCLLYLFQEKLIFHPHKLSKDFVYNTSRDYEEVFIESAGDTIAGLWFKQNNPKGVILFFHGNAGSLEGWCYIAGDFTERGYDLLIIDYHGYGKSGGKITEENLYSDAQASYNFLNDNYNNNDIVIYGRSLGTGIAAYLATQAKAKMLILETPYYSMIDMAKNTVPFIPHSLIMRYELPTWQYLENVNIPVHMVHGTLDRVVPYSSSKRLLQHNKNINLLTIEGGNHNNLASSDGYKQWLTKLLNE